MNRLTLFNACHLATLMIAFSLTASAVCGEAAELDAVPESALSKLPVKEITVFKDGHAFVLHEGRLPTDEDGSVHLDDLPTPVIGTFWPYSGEAEVPLDSVVAGSKQVNINRTALNVRELLEANIGAKVLIKEAERSYAATIVDIPERGAEELAKLNPAASPPGAGGTSHVAGEVIILKTAEGYKVVPVATIQDVTFLEEPNSTFSRKEVRNLLTLRLDWTDKEPQGSAKVGMMYLQKGVRWIPHYKVTIDGKGNAVVRLQATILNEMVDLENVTANLVIGVPQFYFEDTTDPIALAQSAAQLSQYFQKESQSAYALSNSMMTQVARMGEHRIARAERPPADLGPDVGKGDKREDLFIFTVKDLSVKKGERLVLPIVEFSLPYEDVYTLELPMFPPAQIRQQFNTQQQQELAQLFHAPKVMHKLRLANTSKYPLTTCPAIIVQNDRLLAQGLMTYTPTGASVDLSVTQAVDIPVRKTEEEIERTANAANWGGHSYDRIDLSGEITLTNLRGGETEIFVSRYVLGNVEEANQEGQIRALNVFEEGSDGAPHWWTWHRWPVWWYQLNAASRIDWELKLQEDKSVTLKYKWHYFWRN